MYLIVGLGNPGKKYELTRHNIGFEVIDLLSSSLNIPVTKLKFKALIGEGRVGNERVVLAKPQTFMNLSGEAVMAMMKFYNVDSEHLIVIYDDVDTAPGKIRIRKQGSAGTHNGMRSIVSLLKKEDFPRVRIGIGKQIHGDLADYVLGRFSKEEMTLMGSVIEKARDSALMIIEKNVDDAMNQFNAK
jgi:PTH1 family peptidyl-tRNA hydrolase